MFVRCEETAMPFDRIDVAIDNVSFGHVPFVILSIFINSFFLRFQVKNGFIKCIIDPRKSDFGIRHLCPKHNFAQVLGKVDTAQNISPLVDNVSAYIIFKIKDKEIPIFLCSLTGSV